MGKRKGKKEAVSDGGSQLEKSQGSRKRTKKQKVVEVEISDSEESEWEEVESMTTADDLKPSTSNVLPSTSIEISLRPRTFKSEKVIDGELLLKRELNRFRKQQKAEVEKVHLLCLMAWGLRLSKLCDFETARACAVSLIPSGYLAAAASGVDALFLERLLKWFKSAFRLAADFPDLEEEKLLLHIFEAKCGRNESDLTLALTVCLRCLGLEVRFVSSVHPTSLTQDEKEEKDESTKKAVSKKRKNQSASSDGPGKDNFWVEVFLETEERWICVDPVTGTVDQVESVRRRLSPPVFYVLGFDAEGAVGDVTIRYCPGFTCHAVRNLRADGDWWRKTLWAFRSPHRQRQRAEELQLHRLLLDQPLPVVVAEYKNHPLYVLKRDLKKFEAVYPPSTEPVGYVRGEPIFPREAVHTLHAKESWIKEARLIRVDEKPYKIVKARPKLGVPKEEQEERQLPLFGFWQTEPYMAPPAKDGFVPRNEYGNVELFRPSMLPPGTVHLRVPGLLAIAKKLGVDCVAAMVGWEFHGRGSHPILEGWVVCEEHKEALLAAWDYDESIRETKEKKKKQERAIKNWKRLTKCLLLRQTIKKKFLDQPKAAKEEEDETLETEMAQDDAAVAWPQSKHNFSLN